jgi:hypothetical protein
VNGNRRASTIRVPKLFMRTSLPDFRKAKLFQDRDDLAGFENRRLTHFQGMVTA